MEKRTLLKLLALLLFLGAAPAAAQGKVESKKKNLEEINRQLEDKKQELDRYKAEEEKIVSELAGLKKEEKQTAARRAELEAQLERSRARSGETRQKYDSLEKARRELSGDITGELVMFSLQKDFFYPYYGQRDLSKDMLMRSAMFSKRALLSRIKGESAKVNKDLNELKSRREQLQVKRQLLAKQSSAHKNLLKSKQGELEKTREQQAKLERELANLQNAALGLTRLVKKLQKQAPYRSAEGPAELPVPRGSLAWPAQGKVISKFGREDVPGLKTWIVREGIRIATLAGAPVTAAMGGKVIYSGPFRTYGNVVIVDHEKGFFTIYGLLSRIDASKGQEVMPGSLLGLAGEDTQAFSSGRKAQGSAVYFEIRKGDRALDPLKWLKN